MLHLTDKELKELSDKLLNGSITCEENEKLDRWYNQESAGIINWDSEDVNEAALGERLFKGIKKTQNSGLSPALLFLTNSPVRKAAASLICILSAGLIIWFTQVKKPDRLMVKNVLAKSANNNVNKAILTLANGLKVVLDSANNGVIATQGNIQVKKTAKGKLIYHDDISNTTAAETQFNSISTPVSSQYQVCLSDGSKVWLNAASTIKYPTVFNGKERIVQLTGEAYFEVAKNKAKPFKVLLANNTSVQVLGTHFNVKAYTDEDNIDATLLEGSIEVKKGKFDKTIIPGQQAKIADDIKVSTVNAEEAIAWRNGLFSFDKLDTQSIIRQIARWYGVNAIYRGKVPVNHLTGYIARSSNISEVLKMLEMSGIKNSLNNQTITITN